MQKIHTKNHGTIEFIKTWVDSNMHIGITVDGTYCHIGGPVVKNVSDLSIIPYGEEQDAAMSWFDKTYNAKPIPVKAAPVKVVSDVSNMAQVASGLASSAISSINSDKFMEEQDAFIAKLKEVLPKGAGVKVCPICQKECVNSIGLISHMRTHKDEQPEPDGIYIEPDAPRDTAIEE